MRRSYLIVVGVGAVIAFSLILFLRGRAKPIPYDSSQQEKALTTGLGRIPDFSLLDLKGNLINTASFEGKPLIINSWASWCQFCVEELKDFSLAQQELGNQIVIIAVNRGEPFEATKAFTDKLGITDKLVFLLDEKDSFYQAIGGFSMPETIFVDSDRNIVEHKRGPMDEAEIRSKIEAHFRI